MYCLKLRLSSLSIYRVSVHEEALSDYMCVRMRVKELCVASAPLSNVLCVQAPRGGFLDGAYNMRNHYRSLWLEHKRHLQDGPASPYAWFLSLISRRRDSSGDSGILPGSLFSGMDLKPG